MLITGERVSSQHGPFCHCKACFAPLVSQKIEDTLEARLKAAKATEASDGYIEGINNLLGRDYFGAWEELCPRCLDAALNPPTQDGVELDGLYWEREAEAVMRKYYDEQGDDVPWQDND